VLTVPYSRCYSTDLQTTQEAFHRVVLELRPFASGCAFPQSGAQAAKILYRKQTLFFLRRCDLGEAPFFPAYSKRLTGGQVFFTADIQ
jgi:hypothetical protein